MGALLMEMMKESGKLHRDSSRRKSTTYPGENPYGTANGHYSSVFCGNAVIDDIVKTLKTRNAVA